MAVDASESLERGGGEVAADQNELGADDACKGKHQQMMDDGKHKVGGVHARSPRFDDGPVHV
ncbi:hypothetical protein NKI77_02260 [Mesorhizobium opportunistum]|uniref:Uncharacterized protein n=1 Tax=Mesorhizobium opportunistum TaxID=593909 RepID=A0ABV1Y8S6_9HYPH